MERSTKLYFRRNIDSKCLVGVKPVAGTTAFIRFSKMGSAVDDVQFCKALNAESGVLLVPGSQCFGNGERFNGFVRFGFCCETKVLKDGLGKLSSFMNSSYMELPLAEERMA